MGAKTGLNLRTRGIAYKCDICGRKLMSPDALTVHQRTAHNIISRRKKTANNPPKKQVKNNKKPPVRVTNANQGSKLQARSVEFKCPKCFKLFESYNQAQKHIQEFHLIKNELLKTVKPERLEQCQKCQQMVRSQTTHICDTIQPLEITQGFICGACDVPLLNLRSFHVHITGSHIEGVQSLFFPLFSDFMEWKTDMQFQTNSNYVYYERTNAKRFYHCSHILPPQEEGGSPTYCPSIITVQEFSKGLQVHFYKIHFKHKCDEYKLTDKFSKFSIDSFLTSSHQYQCTSDIEYSDPNDLYVQFKSLLEGIIVDAAKVNVTKLRILLGKALEMTSIFSKYEEAPEDVETSPLTDEEINSILNTSKRKLDNNEPIEVKRPKLLVNTPKIVNSFSLAVNSNEPTNGTDSTNDEVVEKTEEEDAKERDPYSSAFNDSYKDFVVKYFPIPEEEKKKLKKRQVVKTKIGQFKPNTSPKNGAKTVEPFRETRLSKANASNPDVTVTDKTSVMVKIERKLKNVEMENLVKPRNTRSLRWEKLSNVEKVSNVENPNDLEKVSNLDKSSNEEKGSTVEKTNDVEKEKAVKKPNVRKLSNVEKTSNVEKPNDLEKVSNLEKSSYDENEITVEKTSNVEKVKAEKKPNVRKLSNVEKVSHVEKSNDFEKGSNLEKSSNEEKESTVGKTSNIMKVRAGKKPNVRQLSNVEKLNSVKNPNSVEKINLRKSNVEKVGNIEKTKEIVRNVSPTLSLEKLTVDPEYEVMEQEGDCNILILKI